MRKQIVGVVALIGAAYVGAYCMLYAFCGPAANMMYFGFFRNPDSVFERPAFYFFYPVYKIHRLFGGPPHYLDRPAPVDVELAGIGIPKQRFCSALGKFNAIKRGTARRIG